MLYPSLLGTNINDAVMKAVEMLVTDKRENRIPERNVDMIILLTDGSPNSGEHLHTVWVLLYLF